MSFSEKIKQMMESAVHFGHQTRRWNPKMRKFLYGSKNGIHIFDLEQTSKFLSEAVEFVQSYAAQGKTIMFVSTKPQAANLIIDISNKHKLPYVVYKWVPGFLTNFSTIKSRIKYFKDLIEEEKNGDFEKYTKKEASKLKKEIAKLEVSLGGVKELERLPDLIILADVVRDRIVVNEAMKKKIPVVAIVDSNADPEGVTKIIPANDDAIKSLTLILGELDEAISAGRSKKK